MSTTPTRRLAVTDLDRAVEQITGYLTALAASGERPWCEVVYPAPDHVEDKAAWAEAQDATFDAVELVDGELVTVAPYAESEAAS